MSREAAQLAYQAVVDRLCGTNVVALEKHGVRVGEGRYMVTLDLESPFNDPALFASPSLSSVMRATLGRDAIINSLAVVIALPGAAEQRVHIDHGMLFPGDEAASMSAPPYALTAIIPLLDLDASTGGTEVWPKGPQMEVPDRWVNKPPGSSVSPLRAGDALLIDYRVCHGGTPNVGLVPRPILYVVYSRPWFRDADNFSEMPPLRVTPEQLADLPAEYRSLFSAAAAVHLV